MKKYFILLCLGICCLWGCKQEDELDSTIALDNLFAIKDDPSDPVKHRVYEIFEKYEVPVYFNDTIGKYLLKTDVSGQPVYRYEVLDPAWSWSSYSSVKFSYGYMTDADEQMKALDVVEEYLETNQRAMYPFCFFIADSIMKTTVENNLSQTEVVKEGEFSIHFRTVLLTPSNSQSAQEKAKDIKRTMVRSKIGQYSTDLEYFYAVSDVNWYGQKFWFELDPSFSMKDVAQLDPDDVRNNNKSEEELEAIRIPLRESCGPFGFVMGDTNFNMCSPYDKKTDL